MGRTRDGGRERWGSCGRKQRFRDESHARAVGQRRNLRAYYCSHCKGWHLTSWLDLRKG